MIFCRHRPALPLAEFIEWFWYYDQLYPDHQREHVLPDGTCELIVDLREEPRRLFDREDGRRHQSFRNSWVSGTHSKYIIIDALPNSSMIGVHFRPGGAGPLLGLPLEAVTDQVIELEALCGMEARRWRDQLLAAGTVEEKFGLMEGFLLQRLERFKAIPERRQRIDWAVRQFLNQPDPPRVGRLADQLGISHKHFITEFRREVGLNPKLFCRIQRFQRALAQAQVGLSVDWADVAYRCGYFDQSHFVHDFHSFSGLTPSSFAARRREDPNFVPVG